jgi:hypothetical protein
MQACVTRRRDETLNRICGAVLDALGCHSCKLALLSYGRKQFMMSSSWLRRSHAGWLSKSCSDSDLGYTVASPFSIASLKQGEELLMAPLIQPP